MHPFHLFVCTTFKGQDTSCLPESWSLATNSTYRRLRLQPISEPLENWSVILRRFSFVGKNMKNAWQYGWSLAACLCSFMAGDDWWSLDFRGFAVPHMCIDNAGASLYMRYDTCCTYDRNKYYVLHCFGWIGVGITQHHPQTKVAQHNGFPMRPPLASPRLNSRRMKMEEGLTNVDLLGSAVPKKLCAVLWDGVWSFHPRWCEDLNIAWSNS